MSFGDLLESIDKNALGNDAFAELPLSLLDRQFNNIIDSIKQSNRENMTFLGPGLSDAIEYSSDNLSDLPDLSQAVGQAVFGDRNTRPEFNFRNNENKYDDERKDDRQQRRDNRGSGMRVISEIMGGKGIGTARQIQQNINNVITSAGGNISKDMNLLDSVAMIKDLVSNRGFSQDSGLLSRVERGIQTVSQLGFNDLDDINSVLMPF